MNSFDLKLIKTVEIPELLETGHDYVFAGRMCVTDINKHDEQDGSFIYTHKGQLTHIEVINKLGKTFKAVAKGSKSQKLRWQIMQHGDNEFYEMVMDKIINNLDEIIQKYV